jgi:hypothetical protein
MKTMLVYQRGTSIHLCCMQHLYLYQPNKVEQQQQQQLLCDNLSWILSKLLHVKKGYIEVLLLCKNLLCTCCKVLHVTIVLRGKGGSTSGAYCFCMFLPCQPRTAAAAATAV